ncbi:MAG: glycosyltransferase [Saprospiraceae bacterium]
MNKTTFYSLREKHWNSIPLNQPWNLSSYYHQWLQKVYSFAIPAHARILELGCGRGQLLDYLKPSYGVGIDFSIQAINHARREYPHLRFELMNAESFDLGNEQFDFIILSDLVNDIWDVQKTMEGIRKYCHSGTRIIINFHSQLWKYPLKFAQKMNWATSLLTQNWFTRGDINTIFQLSGFEMLKHWSEIILPLRIPGANFCNRFLAKIFPFRWFALSNFIVGRPIEMERPPESTCSVIVAARNEEGHIDELFERIPLMGKNMEIIFAEGHSTDNTYAAIEKAIKNHPEKNCRLIKQPGKGKGDAVRAGFEVANGDILMILDADMTVIPEDLTMFYNAITKGKGEFINGVRLVYPMEDKAMRFFNMIGNKFFAAAFTWLLGQPIRDTLCGTKVIWRKDYERLIGNRAYFGNFDPFGDFDLLFGAAKLNLKITEMPVRYHSRRYGETNISRWSHGFLLLKMVGFATRRIKFH